MVKHEITKSKEEINEIGYCWYCGAKLEKIGLSIKKCPNDCMRITFINTVNHCKYPMVS